MHKEAQELEAYVRSTLDAIKGALKEDEQLRSDVEFNVTVKNVQGGEGGLKLHVVTAGGKKNREELTTLRFSVGKKILPAGMFVHPPKRHRVHES